VATSEQDLLRDLTESRVRATRTFEIRHEGSLLAARRLGFAMTLRTFPRWHAPSVGDGLRFAFRGARTIEQKFLEAYAAEKRAILERAEAIENLLNQSGIAFRRLDVASFRQLVFGLLNPDRPAGPPSDDASSRLEEGLAFTHAEIEDASLRLGAIAHHVLSVREVPRETWAGMLPIHAVLEGTFVVNIEVCPSDQVRKFLAAKKRLAFCQMSGGDDKVDVSAMKSEVDQVTAEIFTEGARVYSARTHVLTRSAPDGVINAFSRVGIELVAETAFTGSLFFQSLPLAYDPTNDRTLKRGRRML